jgi:hypothetical protein
MICTRSESWECQQHPTPRCPSGIAPPSRVAGWPRQLSGQLANPGAPRGSGKYVRSAFDDYAPTVAHGLSQTRQFQVNLRHLQTGADADAACRGRRDAGVRGMSHFSARACFVLLERSHSRRSGTCSRRTSGAWTRSTRSIARRSVPRPPPIRVVGRSRPIDRMKRRVSWLSPTWAERARSENDGKIMAAGRG